MRKRDRLPVDKSKGAAGQQQLEQLEPRRLMAISSGGVFDVGNIIDNHPTTTDISDVKNGPMANAGEGLINLYREYRRFENHGGDPADFSTSLNKLMVINNGRVVVHLRAKNGLDAVTTAVEGAGGEVVTHNDTFGLVTAYLPISQLRGMAANAAVATVSPMSRPVFHESGSSNNQADDSQRADLIRSTYGLDGSGVKVGVLSDSVNLVTGGISGSISTGDLPESGVQIIADSDPLLLPNDEGRAMVELIHDIAPGAALAFATANGGQDVYADHIRALRDAGCDIIVDDVIYLEEPFYQPGVVDQAITEFVQGGGIYLSAVGNFGVDGYDAPTRFTTVGGTSFVDFDGSPRVDTRMRFTSQTGGLVVFQWDNPYNGLVGNATADLDIYFYDAARPNRIIAQGTTNNLKTGTPIEEIILPPGQYDVMIRVSDRTPGASLPTRFKFAGDFGLDLMEYNDGVRSATWGHNAGPNTISVGAVPFFNAPPYADDNETINNEAFSSQGPVIHIFDADGNRFAHEHTLNKPDISGIDGINTSFFIGAPTTPLPIQGDVVDDPDSLPNFFGTSAAAPNVAAAIALLKQAAPSATQEQILNALKATARPVNNAPRGTYDPQGGFGLIDAFAAVRQFVTDPIVKLVPTPSTSTFGSISRLKIVFSQQVSNFDVSDLLLTRNGGDNLLTGNNSPITKDGGRSWYVRNLSNVTAVNGTYNFRFDDDFSPVTNILGLQVANDPAIAWTKRSRPAVPADPTGLKARVTAQGTVQLRWEDNSTSEVGYVVQRSLDPAFHGEITPFYIGPDRTTYTDDKLPVGAGSIFYRVRAYNSLKQYSRFTNVAQVAAISGGEVVLDNQSQSGVTIRGSWNSNDDNGGFLGDDYLDDDNSRKGSKSVTYAPTLQASGQYYIYVRWTRAGDRATNTPIDVVINGKVKTFEVDQRHTGGNGWVLLGQFDLTKGKNTSVVIRNDGTDGRVIADAVRFLPADAGLVS
jgi:hypothetical protein